MFGRKKTTQDQAPQAAHPYREGAKNRPTPKRKDQEAARKRPLVGAPATGNKKADRKAERMRRREESMKMREAMRTGDERHLPARDKGPVRRFVRDSVDSRFNIGEILLPLMLGVLLLTLVAQQWATLVFLSMYLIVFLAIGDAILLWYRVKKRIIEKFGPDTPLRGLGLYLTTRAFQLRRTRLPAPMVARGEKPRG